MRHSRKNLNGVFLATQQKQVEDIQEKNKFLEEEIDRLNWLVNFDVKKQIVLSASFKKFLHKNFKRGNNQFSCLYDIMKKDPLNLTSTDKKVLDFVTKNTQNALIALLLYPKFNFTEKDEINNEN